MMMKILNVLLVMAACFLILHGFRGGVSRKNADPNPMKQNQTQFARIQQSYYAEDVNK